MYVSSKTLGRLLLLLVICLFSQSVKAKYGGGTGEPNNPYQIATSEDLILLGNSPEDYDKHFILTVDINISAYTFTTAVIASDINNTDEWEFQGTTFTGCLDGNGHSITGLTIDAGFTGNDYIGLFGHISASSQVKNLGIENVKISGGDYSYYLGGLAGRNKDGSITNCHVLGSIGARDYTVGIGGLLGYNEGGSITNCHFIGNINAGYHSQTFGGLMGGNKYGVITNCYAIGDVRNGNSSTAVGGLVGVAWYGSILRQCHFRGNVSTGKDALFVGGLVGYCRLSWDGGITTSYSICNVVTGDNATYVGVLTGWLDQGEINNCYASGGVTCGKSVGVGGLVGNYDGVISNCYATAIVHAGNDSTSIGGLVGKKDRTCGAINICEYSFWDIQTSGQATSDGGTGLTTAQMQDIQTYQTAGWDFIDEIQNGTSQIWQMPEGGGYPVLAIFNGYTPPQLKGIGSPDNPYLISDATELGAMTYYNPYDYYRLATSIDLSGIRWSTAVIPWFAGTFDGNDLTISNLTINGGGYLGLFGELASGAAIKDLGIADVNVTGSGDYIGVLAANNRGAIIHCHTTGVVNATGMAVGAANRVGGLVGHIDYGTVNQCYSNAVVSGSDSIGGLVGIMYYGSVVNCYSTGTVSGSSSVGGLVGVNYSGSVSNCYSKGMVTGNEYVGGLVGQNGSIVTDFKKPADITKCYCTGEIKGQDYVGGLVGWNNATMADCFWDVQTSGQASSDGGTGLTTAEMQTESTFTDAGWDFIGETANGSNDFWWIDEGKDYPRLWWERSDEVSQF